MKVSGVLLSIDSQMNMQIGELDYGSLPKMFQDLKTMYIRGNAVR